MKFNIIGNFLDSSGYSIHTRELFNSLSKVADVKLTSLIPAGAERFLTDKELECIKKPDDLERINIIITNPVFWRIHTTAKRNWVFFVWEGDKVPKSFIKECMNENIEYVLVPSQHTKIAIFNTEKTQEQYETLKKKVKVILHGVNLSKFYPKQIEKERFTFLMNKGWRHLEDRGGIQYGIKAYLEEFTSQDNVELVIKINPIYGIPNVQAMIEELKPKDKTDFPIIRINADNLLYDKLVDLYNKCDVFVSPTRAESYNLPCIEAMACGKPVITTNFGGQTDFCNSENGWIIGGEMTEVKWEIQYEGVQWLTPDIIELRKAMRNFYDDKEEVKRKGKCALETAKQNTWDEVNAKRLVKLV